jgi:hypothetical protein
VRVTGPGTRPFNEREAAAGRRLLVLLALEANPLTLDYLDQRLHGDDVGPKRAELAAEIRRARSAISHALGAHAALLTTPRAGETALDSRLSARVDLLELYEADAGSRWEHVERLLSASDEEPLSGVSEFSFVYGDGDGGLLRLGQLCDEHRARVFAIRRRLESQHAAWQPPRKALPATVAGAVLAVLLIVVIAVLLVAPADKSTDTITHAAQPEARSGKVLVVDNRVTSGSGMREDRTPVSLSS